MRNIFLKCSTLGLLLMVSARAATNVLDFNTDPVPTGLYTEPGGQSAEWRPSGGSGGGANNGYLVVTRAAGGQSGQLVFKDLESGLVVKAFKFECDLRIGGGTGRPADGFSVNYASADDPATTAGGQFNGTDGEPAPAGLAEEGTQTGLAIGFDTWQSDPIKGVQDVVGMSVRVDGALLAQFPVPLRQGNTFLPSMPNPGAQGTNYIYDEVPYRNLATNDANYQFALQTGSRNNTDDLNGDGTVDGTDPDTPQPESTDPNYDLWIKNLTWEHFSAELTEDGHVIITWKGKEITPPGGLPTTFTPRPGRIILAGRTGGAWEVHHVDNIRLVTIPADKLIIGPAVGNPIGFTITTTDSGPASSDTNTIVVKFNDTPVTPTSITKGGITTTIVYKNLNSPLVIGTTNKVSLSIKDSRGLEVTGDRNFVVQPYQVLNAAFAVTGVDTSKAGFKLRTYQVATGQENSIIRAEQQLHGDRGANIASPADFTETGVINYTQDGAPAGSGRAGNWTDQTDPNDATHFADKAIPGAVDPAGGTDPNNIAMEILTYINFPKAGVYTLIFNSDDGFRTSVYSDAREQLESQILAQFDGGRGASDTPIALLVPTPGFYPVRTVWFEGGGGANMEWVAINDDGVKALINDGTTQGSLQAYSQRTGATPSVVIFVSPLRGGTATYLANVGIRADIEDGSAAPLDASSINLTVNGTKVTPTVNKTGTTTKIVYNPTAFWAPGSSNAVSLTYKDTANPTVTRGTNWYFLVQGYINVPPSMALPAGQVDKTKTGFLVKGVQQDIGLDNSNYRAEVQLAGLVGLTNFIDPAPFTGPSGYYVESGVINYNQDAPAAVGNFNSNNGYEDKPVPGIPGVLRADGMTTAGAGADNYAEEFLTVIDFPQPGLYVMGVNSDDGFQTSVGNPKDRLKVVLGFFDGGRGASDTTFAFYIQQAGLYPVRTIWEEGGGGSNCEWFSQDAAANGIAGVLGARILLNDTATAGYLKVYQYPLSSAGSPWVKSYTPAISGRGNHAGNNAPIQVVLADGAGSIDPATVSLKLDNTAVSPTVNKTGTETTVSYQTPTPFAGGSTHAVALTYGDRTLNWSFSVTSSNIPAASFFIEAEDFNYGGGQTKAEASAMPYTGGAYTGLAAVDGVDYHRDNETDSPLYRVGENPQVPMDRTGDRDRGVSEIVVNYKLGWIGTGMWYNYTRTFPNGNYNVYAGLSHGDAPTTTTRVHGMLQKVTSDPAQPNQTVADLGTFDAPATGGWGSNALVPMTDSGGNLASVNLSGATTIRMVPTNGDFDFILFTPAGATGPQITSAKISAGSITVNWTGGGTLESTTTLNAGTTWTTTGNSSGTFTESVGTGNKFYRVKL